MAITGPVGKQQQQSSNFILSEMAAGPWDFAQDSPVFTYLSIKCPPKIPLESSEFSFNH